ncbi:hypothetical protein [Streptomyces clavuligerus]|uniref:Type II toxin-antitoxin system RelE/ParE family toxin n=1 Tax=Streptomyces clavuligerus TaxID=1901 RepID=E2Q5U7_STRCL|nr:hypothetical protein [Streptomyces clavuligerus]ANW21706.1 hypothetical protein BB341_27570 [Streptomyces clavuligerus]AXU16335.1 hypothetical protein D1794_28640 [Streptomyces clavuligerus]EFG05107.1 Hypothetical protein SCLAV_0031 [Streptomyces clavuligerus]MBY6306496.1 hypothetical protein [Streptomyces clavuligerus]QCS09115.1 hypothetical protein CRV15_28000 [Streptomyces clavuligerus]
MSRYRITYSHRAETGLASLAPGVRTQVESQIARSVGNDPYGHGSAPVGKDKDLRDATIGRFVIIRYKITSNALVVTVLRAVAPW